MSLETIELQTEPEPRASVIVLHGLGADGNDFVPVVQALDLSAIGPTRFIFPHAPVRPVTVNGGARMRAWYDVLSLDGPDREDAAGLRRSRQAIDELIARERERGIAARRIVLAGFSQGAAMTLMAGLRHPERLAGLLAMSGYLPLAAHTAAERHAANADVPIFLAHGRFDPVVPFHRGVESRQVLVDLGYPVDWHEYPMAHSVSMEEIADLNAWLGAVLAKTPG